MPMLQQNKHRQSLLRSGLLLVSMVTLLGGCSSIDPRKVDVEMPREDPVVKRTTFDHALNNLGKMTEVYGKRVMIQGKDIIDAVSYTHLTLPTKA